ncbi:hypothetical protein ACF073_24010 [Streptomyces sp. NPDC015171]|uniref:hypothetical protein n=1 Tax=Streptomyces sp. NPDC015171 TaxID=3364945 RepID=UPI0036FE372D
MLGAKNLPALTPKGAYLSRVAHGTMLRRGLHGDGTERGGGDADHHAVRDTFLTAFLPRLSPDLVEFGFGRVEHGVSSEHVSGVPQEGADPTRTARIRLISNGRELLLSVRGGMLPA